MRDIARLRCSCSIIQAKTQGRAGAQAAPEQRDQPLLGFLPVHLTQLHAQQPAPRLQLHCIRAGLDHQKPLRGRMRSLRGCCCPRVWMHMIELAYRADYSIQTMSQDTQMARCNSGVYAYLKIIFYYCESIHAMLIMHIYKFKFTLCYCEPIHVSADCVYIQIPTGLAFLRINTRIFDYTYPSFYIL